jgi:hypothetical protein
MPQAKLERLQGCSAARFCYARPREEYCADFMLIARRTLDEWHYRLFELWFLHNADWKVCAKRLNTDRGNLFHAVYRLQQQLGAAFALTAPYGLYPVDEYIQGRSALAVAAPAEPLRPGLPARLRYPSVPLLQRAA